MQAPEQLSDGWRAARRGLVTASKADRLMTPTGRASKQWEDYAALLAGEVYTGRSLDETPSTYAMERGIELEPVAASWYAYHADVELAETGFVVGASGEYGASPDRMIGDDGVLEIKCCMDKGHAAAIGCYAATGKPPPDYIPQVCMQLLATGRAYGDLCYWHPDMPAIVYRIHRDAAADALLLAQIELVVTRRETTLAAMRELGGETTGAKAA